MQPLALGAVKARYINEERTWLWKIDLRVVNVLAS
jgi:hypothetical protein